MSEEDDEPLDQGIPFPFPLPFPLPFGNLNPEVLFGAGGPVALPFPPEILNTVLGGGPPLELGNGLQLEEDPAGGVVLQCSIM